MIHDFYSDDHVSPDLPGTVLQGSLSTIPQRVSAKARNYLHFEVKNDVHLSPNNGAVACTL